MRRSDVPFLRGRQEQNIKVWYELPRSELLPDRGVRFLSGEDREKVFDYQDSGRFFWLTIPAKPAWRH